jgi:hypothetical protein
VEAPIETPTVETTRVVRKPATPVAPAATVAPEQVAPAPAAFETVTPVSIETTPVEPAVAEPTTFEPAAAEPIITEPVVPITVVPDVPAPLVAAATSKNPTAESVTDRPPWFDDLAATIRDEITDALLEEEADVMDPSSPSPFLNPEAPAARRRRRLTVIDPDGSARPAKGPRRAI